LQLTDSLSGEMSRVKHLVMYAAKMMLVNAFTDLVRQKSLGRVKVPDEPFDYDDSRQDPAHG